MVRRSAKPSGSRPPIPREHGAWALLYGPFLFTLLVVPGDSWAALFLLIAMTALFLAHEPLAKLLRGRKHGVREDLRRHWWRWTLIYGSLFTAAGSVLLLVYERWLLIPLGLSILLLLSWHLLLAGEKQERSLGGELLGVVGLTASSPVTYYVVSGQLNDEAALIWALNLVYFASGVFHVKLILSRFIRQKESPARHRQSLSFHLAALLLLATLTYTGQIHWILWIPYLPVFLRAFWGLHRGPETLQVKRLGYREVAYTLFFVFSGGILWNFWQI